MSGDGVLYVIGLGVDQMLALEKRQAEQIAAADESATRMLALVDDMRREEIRLTRETKRLETELAQSKRQSLEWRAAHDKRLGSYDTMTNHLALAIEELARRRDKAKTKTEKATIVRIIDEMVAVYDCTGSGTTKIGGVR